MQGLPRLLMFSGEAGGAACKAREVLLAAAGACSSTLLTQVRELGCWHIVLIFFIQVHMSVVLSGCAVCKSAPDFIRVVYCMPVHP